MRSRINALCVAFYARSEEARQTHSAHKLALILCRIGSTCTRRCTFIRITNPNRNRGFADLS
ncbi:hypothetical protein GBA52_015899 [Prunus armeniaca]|nr:hypothetical protein GBA52_015899 [Prunus armeniaca]